MTSSNEIVQQVGPPRRLRLVFSGLRRMLAPFAWQVMITSSAIVFALASSYLLPKVGMSVITGHMLGPLPVVRDPTPIPDFQDVVKNANTRLRLAQQLNEIRALEQHHFQSMLFVDALSYAAIHQVLLASAISAACLFLITKLGWDNSSASLKNFFLSFAAIAAIAGAFPQVFRYAENITQNKSRYLEYSALGREIETYMLTGRFRRKDVRDPGELVAYVDSELRRLDDFSLLMDVSSLPRVRLDPDSVAPAADK
jgi:hypothetical protein